MTGSEKLTKIPYNSKVPKRMDLASCFPGLFAIKRIGGYKIYINKIQRTLTESVQYTSVIGSVTEYAFENIYEYSPPQIRYKTVVRKWCGGPSTPCQWSYSGLEMSVVNLTNGLTKIVPVIYIAESLPTLFPIGSTIVTPLSEATIQISSPSIYESGTVYTTDPYSAGDNLEYRDVQPNEPVIIPPHVKRIVIQDSIRRGEPCAISYNDIEEDTAGMTSCGHVFNMEAIRRWLTQTSSGGLCPICKQKCTLI